MCLRKKFHIENYISENSHKYWSKFHVWKQHVIVWIENLISFPSSHHKTLYIYILKVNFKCTLVCRHLMLRWKISSNKICRSQREQVRTSSTILFQISNFDSKLHLKRRYFLLITKTLEFWSADSTRKWYCQSISDW